MEDITLSRPTLDSGVRVIPLSDGRIQIRTATDRISIGRQASLALAMLNLCDGTRTAEEITSALEAQGHAADQARALLQALTARHMLTDDDAPATCDLILDNARHIARQALGHKWRSPTLETMRDVYVIGVGHLAAAVRAELTNLSLYVGEDCEPLVPGPPLIVACSDYEHVDSFRDTNSRAIQEHSPVLFACIADPVVRIGPCVVPQETACFECYYHRLRANLTFRDEFDGWVAHNAALETCGADSRAHVHARLAAALVAGQVINFLYGITHHCLLDSIVELHPLTLEMTVSRVLRLPRCEVCGCGESSHPVVAVRDWV
jgi:bacteriocin biosynthesis cyclodehydratase domain-containing protein